jgi:hypothetical protein
MAGAYWTEVNGAAVDSWAKIVAYVDGLTTASRRIFRGLSSSKHELLSSLERTINETEKNTLIRIPHDERWRYEAQLLFWFKRRAHFYLGTSETPHASDFLEWFGLMRHFGAPSRLLDFSYSFPVATYFAINGATEDAAVFCIDYDWLVHRVEGPGGFVTPDKSFQHPAVFWEYAMQRPPDRNPFVVPVRPFRSNERIHVQQGLFLCPTDVNRDFAENMMALGNVSELESNVIRLTIKRDLHPEIMPRLREMNISCETLYPGLEGFARSLRDLFYLPRWRPTDLRLVEAISKEPPF